MLRKPVPKLLKCSLKAVPAFCRFEEAKAAGSVEVTVVGQGDIFPLIGKKKLFT